MEQFIEDLAHSLGAWAYLLVAFMATAETAAFLGFIAPGEFTIILGGVLAGEGTLSIWLLIGIVWTSIVIGDSIGFTLGRRLGREFAERHGHRVRLTEERLQKVDAYFKRHGGKTIFFGRWLGFVRPLMPFTAGASGMPYKQFLPYDVLSAGLFGSVFCLLGFIFWRSFEQVASTAGKGAIAFAVLVALAVGIMLAVKRLRDPAQRQRLAAYFERLGRKPLLRPFAAVLVRIWRFPPLRFLGRRLTPGELGIEFTTVLAIAAVCGFLFGLYTDLVTSGSSVVTPGDSVAKDIAREINAGVLTTLAKVITVFGSWPLVTAVVLVGAAALSITRRVRDAAVLVLGFGLTQAGIYITKAAVERPRPSNPLIDASGWSFPSAHAATAVAYVVLGVIVARALPNLTWRVALIVGTAVLTVLVGLTRIYLRAHYWSDVAAGWSLALAIFALCGCIGMVISFLRKNEPVNRDNERASYG
jgi:membrane protein DedA with SNARE-associated domain/membrane-associated phospholipid phosphatase